MADNFRRRNIFHGTKKWIEIDPFRSNEADGKIETQINEVPLFCGKISLELIISLFLSPPGPPPRKPLSRRLLWVIPIFMSDWISIISKGYIALLGGRHWREKERKKERKLDEGRGWKNPSPQWDGMKQIFLPFISMWPIHKIVRSNLFL